MLTLSYPRKWPWDGSYNNIADWFTFAVDYTSFAYTLIEYKVQRAMTTGESEAVWLWSGRYLDK